MHNAITSASPQAKSGKMLVLFEAGITVYDAGIKISHISV